MSNSATSTPRTDSLVGTTFGGRYTLIQRLGSSGTGQTYLARDVQERRDVAVKLLAPDGPGGDDPLAPFEREARRLRGLAHPNIAAVLDHGREHGHKYLVRQHVEGERLSNFLSAHGALELGQFVPIAAQLLKGIGHAHSRELAIGNLTPATILLCERKGRANFLRILEFGLDAVCGPNNAERGQDPSRSVAYLAPERAAGGPSTLRADVYAVGALFYAMLCGHLPVETSDGASVPDKSGHAKVAPLRKLLGPNHEASDGLLSLILRCLASDERERPADANELVEELIDVVPAALFRLPRVAAASHGGGAVPVAPAGAGNTGMVELVGTAAKTGPYPIMRSEHTPSNPAELRAVVSPLPQLASAEPNAAEQASPPLPRSGPSNNAGMFAVAAIVLLGGAAIASWIAFGGPDNLGGSDGSDNAGQSVSVAGAGEANAPSKNAAEPTPANGRGTADSAATPATPNTAATAETAADGALVVAGSSAAPATDAAVGEVIVRSSPLANLSIDGEPSGTTPFEGKLPLGTHHIRLTARDHAPWTGTVVVSAEGTAPLQIDLPRKRAAHPVSPAAAPATTRDPSGDPPPAEPVAKPVPKANVFLPTPKSGSGEKGVFLPTKD